MLKLDLHNLKEGMMFESKTSIRAWLFERNISTLSRFVVGQNQEVCEGCYFSLPEKLSTFCIINFAMHEFPWYLGYVNGRLRQTRNIVHAFGQHTCPHPGKSTNLFPITSCCAFFVVISYKKMLRILVMRSSLGFLCYSTKSAFF